jgi:hypothetical protein
MFKHISLIAVVALLCAVTVVSAAVTFAPITLKRVWVVGSSATIDMIYFEATTAPKTSAGVLMTGTPATNSFMISKADFGNSDQMFQRIYAMLLTALNGGQSIVGDVANSSGALPPGGDGKCYYKVVGWLSIYGLGY